MPRSRRGRSYRGRSSVFTPGAQSVSNKARQASPTTVSAGSSRSPAMTETVGLKSMLGDPMTGAFTPNIEEGAPEGAGGPPVDVDYGPGFTPEGEGSQLVDAIMQEENPLAADTGAAPLPSMDEIYAGGPPPVTQEQVEAAGGVVPGNNDPFGLNDWLAANSDYYGAQAQQPAYNDDVIARLMARGRYF